jgi:hypothetical protein
MKKRDEKHPYNLMGGLKMVFLALILMAAAAISIDYLKVRSERKEEKTQSFNSTNLNHIPA